MSKSTHQHNFLHEQSLRISDLSPNTFPFNMNVCICKCCIIHCELARRNCWLCLIYLALNLFFFSNMEVFLKCRIKIPNAVLKEGITVTGSNDKVFDFFLQSTSKITSTKYPPTVTQNLINLSLLG